MPNALCHFELMTSDPARSRKFYSSLFEWTFDDQSLPGYTLIHTGQDPTGGMFPRPHGQARSCLNVYFTVTDIERTLAKAVQNGGKVIVPKTNIPGTGHFAMLTDPDGVAVGIMQPA